MYVAVGDRPLDDDESVLPVVAGGAARLHGPELRLVLHHRLDRHRLRPHLLRPHARRLPRHEGNGRCSAVRWAYSAVDDVPSEGEGDGDGGASAKTGEGTVK